MRASAVLLALGLSLLGASQAAAEPLSYPGDSANYSWVVTSYYDQGGVTDWNCGGNTYSGHQGTDFAIVGSWQAMAEGRPVFAAAGGVVETTHDGEPDMCMTGDCGGGGGWGNHVRIAHLDGSRTLYAHLKTFSLLVSDGQQVECGQKIGEVGSSGNSTGPHLHLEYWTNSNYTSRIDPFKGGCSPSPGVWIEQGPYNGLPTLSCEDVILPWPVFTLTAGLDGIDGQEPDFNPAPPSQGIFDMYEGQTVTQWFTVANGDDNGAAAEAVEVGFSLSAHWQVVDWVILDNWSGNSCGGDWCPNDSNDLPENLPPDQLGESFTLNLAAMSPGESKRVALTLAALTPTAVDEHARAGFFVKAVPGVYEKTDFDAAPVNVDDRQTWNGGDLKFLIEVDIYPDMNGTTGDTDPTTGGT
ncbi:MAG: M23 family metallopeptidase, partial [Myxococcales bacterium]|nr:M23 family metallopeptidase [Myxococcales bacterium]